MAETPFKAGPLRYMGTAFRNRWNLLAFAGAVGAALLSPWPDAVLLLVTAAEVGFLGMVTSFPRFRQAVDAQLHKREAATQVEQGTSSLAAILRSLPAESRRRFEAVRGRCQAMRVVAQNVRGRVGEDAAADAAQTSGLDRLLWTFLRMLLSQAALQQFLQSTNEQDLVARHDALKGRLESEGPKLDERMRRSLGESVATAQARLDNYRKAKANGDFIALEVQRIEESIHTLVEMSVNRQDPDFLTAQVNATVDSMRRTEDTLTELQSLTGLTENMNTAPAILDAPAEVKEGFSTYA